MAAKRIFDFIASLVGLIILAPLGLFVAIWIKVDSPGPVFFRHERVGYRGRSFRIHKFRTMFENAEGLPLTVSGDKRITNCGRFLRKYKLDELPQLIDVLRGEMSLVGPRPEVPKYVALYPDDIKNIVLSVPPGITDFAAIEFREENEILNCSIDPEKDYLEKILPIKLKYYREYINKQSLSLDITLILKTIKVIFK